MYYIPFSHQCYYCVNVPMYSDGISVYWTIPNNYDPSYEDRNLLLKDYGPKPFVVNINKAAKQNHTFRTALWTGKHFQITLMSIGIGEDIGLSNLCSILYANLPQPLHLP